MIHLGYGHTRSVFLSKSGRYVVKIPLNDQGINDNWSEALQYNRVRNGRESLPIARCRMFKHVFIMELVTIGSLAGQLLPDWCDSIDCRQVGRTRKNKLVAYDYA